MTINKTADVGQTCETSFIEKADGYCKESITKQKDVVTQAISSPLIDGDKWYLLDMRWYKLWENYVNQDDTSASESYNPGPIDNSMIVDPNNGKLKEHLLEQQDYMLINEEGWSKLASWYGLVDNQEPICRKVVQHGLYMKETKVEVYLIELKLCSFNDMDNVVLRSFSKGSTIAEVLVEAKKALNIPEDVETRLWYKFMQNTYEIITKMDTTLQDHTITSGQMLVLELKNKSGEWPRQTRNRSLSGSTSGMVTSDQSLGSSSISDSYSYMGYGDSRQRTMSTKPGLCGLANIGNTCFMNSALQCLSNTTPLTRYFLSGAFKHELNPNNPLGMQGKIAEAYAELLHHVWGSNTYFTPRHFKMQVGRFAPQFSGYQQQDSHELLAFLLDGLHEDLNRVKQKPYIELQDDKGRPDEVCASEAWKNHNLRNSSIIVDLFHGLFKSTVQCPVCQKKSVTFDPFCYLSLPLPIKKERNLGITFVPLEVSKAPIKLKVTVPKLGNILDLTSAVSKLTGTDPNKMVVADVFHSKFHKIYEPNESLSQMTDRDDIKVYEIPIDIAASKDGELLILPVYLRNMRETSYTYNYGYSNHSLFGTPIFVFVPRDSVTAKDLYKIILRSMQRFEQAPAIAIDKVDQYNEDICDDHDDEQKIKEDTSEKDSFEDEEKKEDALKGDTPDFLFQICIVNSAGNQIMSELSYEDTKPLNLNAHTYLAIDCTPEFKNNHSETFVQEPREHSSWNAEIPLKKPVNLKDCLDLFLQEEKLGEDDPWYCPQCKVHRQAYKKFDLWTLPKILVIHLKRFSYNRYWRDKLDALVDFPIKQLDLTDYVIDKNHPRAVYDLHAVSNHFGGLGGGHYTAYGVNCYDGQWYYFDDASVTSANTEAVVSKAAYVLFYTRREDPDNEMMNTSELLTDDFCDEKMDSS